jgi:nucleotide-binding universal stress UspA family protein
MKSLNKILLPTDFSSNMDHAFSEAFRFAKKYQAELHILHVSVYPIADPYTIAYYYPNPDEMNKILENQIQDDFFKLKEEYKSIAKKLVTVHRAGSRIPSTILEYADEINADLIVMPSHGRKGFGHFLMGSVSEEICRLAKSSVLITKNESNDLADIANNKILVPIDFSDYSKEALKVAENFAKEHNAKLDLIHVIPNAVQFHVEGSYINILKDYPHLINETTDGLKKFYSEKKQFDIDADYHVKFGDAASEIVDFSNQNDVKLIVMSTHGLTGIKKFFIGSIAEKVLRSSDCPVLIVK